ncbi:MAG TPA: hypothetical protein VGL19_06835, partial [Polyangiaceae bacterium]
PPSYTQPMILAAFKAPVLAELNQLLDDGYTVALPKDDFMSGAFESDFRAELAKTSSTKSEHYEFFKRSTGSPRVRRRRSAPTQPADAVH